MIPPLNRLTVTPLRYTYTYTARIFNIQQQYSPYSPALICVILTHQVLGHRTENPVLKTSSHRLHIVFHQCRVVVLVDYPKTQVEVLLISDVGLKQFYPCKSKCDLPATQKAHTKRQSETNKLNMIISITVYSLSTQSRYTQTDTRGIDNRRRYAHACILLSRVNNTPNIINSCYYISVRVNIPSTRYIN